MGLIMFKKLWKNGGHFSAAAVEREGVSVQQMKDMILNCIEEELKNEGNIA